MAFWTFQDVERKLAFLKNLGPKFLDAIEFYTIGFFDQVRFWSHIWTQKACKIIYNKLFGNAILKALSVHPGLSVWMLGVVFGNAR